MESLRVSLNLKNSNRIRNESWGSYEPSWRFGARILGREHVPQEGKKNSGLGCDDDDAPQPSSWSLRKLKVRKWESFPTRMSPQNKDNDPLVAVTESESSSYDESQANHEEAGEEVYENTTETTYNVGDHVYTWISFMGVPFATQEHGIVVDLEESHIILVRFQKEEAEEGDDETRNFNMIKERISRIDGIKKWHKIPYGVNWVKRMITRAGTANPIKADDPAMILRRVGWLWKNQFLLLQNLAGETNEKDISECIAVWCMTGNFFSYHGMAKMGHHGADMATGAKLAGSVCTQAAVTTVVPLMLPVFAAYDITTAVDTLTSL